MFRRNVFRETVDVSKWGPLPPPRSPTIWWVKELSLIPDTPENREMIAGFLADEGQVREFIEGMYHQGFWERPGKNNGHEG